MDSIFSDILQECLLFLYFCLNVPIIYVLVDLLKMYVQEYLDIYMYMGT